MDDRFIGYRGSQANEWSWEPDGGIEPHVQVRRRGKYALLAVLSALAIFSVVITAVFLVAGRDGGSVGSTVVAPTTPTREPVASPMVRPTAAPPKKPTPTPASPPWTAEILLWNGIEWQGESLARDASDYAEGDTIPFRYKVQGLEPGRVFEFSLTYFARCNLWPEQSFDHLGSLDAPGDAPRTQGPGPGRSRPDSQIPVPDDPDVPNDSAGAAYLAAWGGTFQSVPVLSPATTACSGGRSLSVQILAQSSGVYIQWGGHLASRAEWPEGGAAQAETPFGMSAKIRGLAETRIGVLPGAISQ